VSKHDDLPITYNSQDLPELLLKRWADCQEIAVIANIKYTDKQLLMDVIDLLTQCRIYYRDLNDWDRKTDQDETYYNLHPFFQAACQCHLLSGTMTARQGGYPSYNPFAGLTQEENGNDDKTVGTT
jgi:hypothetical protein